MQRSWNPKLESFFSNSEDLSTLSHFSFASFAIKQLKIPFMNVGTRLIYTCVIPTVVLSDMAANTITTHVAHKNKIIPSVDYVKYNSVQLATKPV